MVWEQDWWVETCRGRATLVRSKHRVPRVGWGGIVDRGRAQACSLDDFVDLWACSIERGLAKKCVSQFAAPDDTPHPRIPLGFKAMRGCKQTK